MRGEDFPHVFEAGAYAVAAGLSNALAAGSARGDRWVAEARADQAEAATLDSLAVVGQALARDRRELAKLQAENAALKAEVAAYRAAAVKAAAVARRDGRRVA
ncbi:hypothetical protein FV226_24490 [Methylobacterium sp. WL12]|uniref:hypothetical protein n=1 Tax=Methylobacterium sp. WL12 TaxID=2603890 RepID=UPI0011C7896E|nr:hypothetical protein [Methylobacterium sp. WL12]TXM65775.1 hypothetical protein FV226_24490 [Methylobacterium sp. WL12]